MSYENVFFGPEEAGRLLGLKVSLGTYVRRGTLVPAAWVVTQGRRTPLFSYQQVEQLRADRGMGEAVVVPGVNKPRKARCARKGCNEPLPPHRKRFCCGNCCHTYWKSYASRKEAL